MGEMNGIGNEIRLDITKTDDQVTRPDHLNIHSSFAMASLPL